MINYHIKGLYKTTFYKTKSRFFQFFFSHWLLHKFFFSFLIKAFSNFEKLIRFLRQGFIVYKNGENLRMPIQIFCQKLIVSNVILAFLDHLKPKIFFVGQPWWPRERAFFKRSGSAPGYNLQFSSVPDTFIILRVDVIYLVYINNICHYLITMQCLWYLFYHMTFIDLFIFKLFFLSLLLVLN